jgi:hypothetical protein
MSQPPPDVSSQLPHLPTRRCDPWHCYYHHRDEPSSGYRVCGECAHTYSTADDLKQTYLDYAPAGLTIIVEDMTADEIYFCPLCLHDF